MLACGARAAFIGGFDSTSNVRAGKLFDIPVSGTHAHALVQTYGEEYTAFKNMLNDIKIASFGRYFPYIKIGRAYSNKSS